MMRRAKIRDAKIQGEKNCSERCIKARQRHWKRGGQIGGLALTLVLAWTAQTGSAFAQAAANVPANAPASESAGPLSPFSGGPRGPLAIRDARPYNLLFLQFMPETSDVLPARANMYGLQLDVINNLLIPVKSFVNGQTGASVREDNEYQRLMLSWRRGLGHGLELAVYAPLEWRNGGFLDSILSGYHRLTGLPGNGIDNPIGRDGIPQFQSALQIVDATGQTRLSQGNAFGLGETNVTLKRSLLPQSGRASLAARLGVKVPTGNPTLLLGSGAFDVGLSLDGRYSLGRSIVVYANVGGALLGQADRHVRIAGARPNVVQTLAALEYRPNSRDSFVLQLDGNSRVVRTGNRIADDWQATATFGYQRVLDRHHLLLLSFSENGDIHNYSLPAFSNIGPDITFSAGVKWR